MSDFIDRLTYLLGLSRGGRLKNKDYCEMVRLLKEDDHWKARHRGDKPKSRRKRKRKKMLEKPISNKQGSGVLSSEQQFQKDYFESM